MLRKCKKCGKYRLNKNIQRRGGTTIYDDDDDYNIQNQGLQHVHPDRRAMINIPDREMFEIDQRINRIIEEQDRIENENRNRNRNENQHLRENNPHRRRPDDRFNA